MFYLTKALDRSESDKSFLWTEGFSIPTQIREYKIASATT